MTPPIDDFHSERPGRSWARPLARFASRRGRIQPHAATPVRITAPVPLQAQADAFDDGEDLLRRLREAGL